jgi:translation initiation factor IF-1
MPGLSAKSAKKGMSHVAQMRKDANRNIVKAAVEGELEGCTFGKVIKMFGGANVQVVDMEKKEAIGVIRGLLRRKGVTPIAPGDVVIMSERGFESKGKKTYDIVGITNGAAASTLNKDGVIPDWMIGAVEAVGAKAAGGAGASGAKDEDEIEFDYDEEVDVDAI